MISAHLTFWIWRKKNMYKSMKILIGKKFYKDGETAQKKLDVFFAVDRLTGAEYTELTALIGDIYGGDAV